MKSVRVGYSQKDSAESRNSFYYLISAGLEIGLINDTG